MTPDFENMVLIAARKLSDCAAQACNVNALDHWDHYCGVYIDDARVSLESCGAKDLLAAARLTLATFNARGISMPEEVGDALVAAIAKATGEQS